MNYKVGDKIKVLVEYYSGCMPNGCGPKIGDILTVVEEQKCTTRGNWIDDRTAEVTQVNFYGSTEFALVEVKNRFAAGDKVILANPKAASRHELEEGWIGYVLDPNDGTGDISVQVAEEKNPLFFYYFDEDELELLSAAKDRDWRNRDDITPQDIAGIVKPDVINSPKHYAVFEQLEAIQVIANSMTQDQFYGYCLGNILKYRLRAGGKDDVMQELGKADKYQELYTEHKHLCKEGK